MRNLLLVGCIILFSPFILQGQGSWEKLRDFPGPPTAWAVSFTLNNNIYIGSGYDSTGLSNKFWVYKAQDDYWKPVAPLPGPPRDDATSFVHSGFAYVGFGIGTVGNESEPLKDLWRYDPLKDTWNRCADLPGSPRLNPFSIVLQNTVLVGCGRDQIRTGKFLDDIWEYTPDSNTWRKLSPFPGGGRFRAIGRKVRNRVYVGIGIDEDKAFNDWWNYKPKTDTWVKVGDLPHSTGKYGYTSFILKNNLYLGVGMEGTRMTKEVLRYNAKKDQWSEVALFPGSPRVFAISQATSKFAIVGLGYNQDGLKSDLWKYTP